MLGLELKERNKKYISYYIYYILLFLLSYCIIDYTTIIYILFGINIDFSHVSSLLIPIFSMYLFFILLNNLINNTIYKIIIFILVSISIIGILPEIIHIAIFDKPIDYISMMTLADTNKSEVYDFIETYISLKVLCLIILLIILPYIIIYFLPKYSLKIKVKSWKFIFISLLVFVSFILTFPRAYVLREIKPIFLYKTYKQVITDKKLFIENISKNIYNDYDDIIINSNSDNNTYVLVIGESADRNRYSLYSYERNTSPYLAKIKDELYIFDDVISPHAHTSSSLEKILTFADLRNKDLKYKYGSIIHFFNSAGFKTFWLSNQYKYGNYDAGYTAIANASTEKIYINSNSWTSNKTTYYDEKLVEELENILKNNYGNKLIILHLFGSHSPYSKRYPKEFNIYNSSHFLANINPESKFANVLHYNAYDNSIVYTDFVLYKIIFALKQVNINGYMLYFSDHGEDAGTSDKNVFYGHNEAISTKPMYEIPFILWLSEKYKNENKEKINSIAKSIHKSYQTDRIIHTIIDLSNMDNTLFKKEDSIINENYKEVMRTYGGKEYFK